MGEKEENAEIEGYRIERSYGTEKIEDCMMQIVRMAVAERYNKDEEFHP